MKDNYELWNNQHLVKELRYRDRGDKINVNTRIIFNSALFLIVIWGLYNILI